MNMAQPDRIVLSRRAFCKTAIAAGIAVTLGFSGCVAPEEKKKAIKVLVMGPMEEEPGIMIRRGAEMAAEEINAAGGILGRPIELVIMDDKNNPEIGVKNVEEAVAKHGVILLVGVHRSEVALAVQELLAKYKLIYLNTISASPYQAKNVAENYEKYKYFFRIYSIVSTELAKFLFSGVAYLANILRDMGIEPKASVICEKAVWADAVYNAGLKLLPEKLGIEVVYDARPSPTASDVTTELLATKSAGANIIYMAFSGPVSIPFSKTVTELEIPAVPIGVSTEAQRSAYWDIVDGKCNYEIIIHSHPRAPLTPKTIEFWDKFKEKYGEGPALGAHSYDALYIYKEAVERAGTFDPDPVIKELEKTDYIGTTGRIKFRKEDHDVMYPSTAPPSEIPWITWYFVQWLNGKMETVYPTELATAEIQIPPRVIKYHKK